MYYLQDVDIKFADVVKEQPPLMNKLSLSPYFRFDQSEITKFHAELLLLIRELSRMYLTRNEISLLSQEDEENIVAGTKGTEEKTAIENETAVFEEELQLALASEDEKELDLAIASEQDNVAVVTQTDEAETFLGSRNASEEDAAVERGKEVVSIGPSSLTVVNAMRISFYNIYMDHYESVKEKGTSVMTKATYDEKVQLLKDSERYKGRTKPMDMQNALTRFTLVGQVKDRQLYRKTKEGQPTKVPYLEILFDVIHEAHLFLAHAKDTRITKIHIDSQWWGVPENAIKVYRNLCPQCLRHSRPPAIESLQPLRMIISDTIGSRCQMDLIDYTRHPDMTKDGVFTWILRYVDHFSGFSHVAPLKDKSSRSVGNALMSILSTAVLPEILQSDNGKDFLGYCIKMIKEEFHTIKVIKGRAYHPQSQGSVERGNATFKEALDKWLVEQDNITDGSQKKSWSQVGVYMVNAKLNNRPSQSKDKKSPYEIYYGKKSYGAPSYILDNNLLSVAKSEYSVLVVLQIMEDVAKVNKCMDVEMDLLKRIIEEADDVYEFAESMGREDEESYDVDAELQKVVDKYTNEILVTGKKKQFNTEECKKLDNQTPIPKTPESITRRSTRSSDRKSSNDSPGRGRIREGVKEAKIKQANRVNDLRDRKSKGKVKTPLEAEDICTISIPKTIKSAVKNLPVMVTEVAYKRQGVRYKVCSRHGHLAGTFSRSEVAHRKNYTKDILKIDSSVEDFKKKLTLQQACQEFSNITGCNCVTDCSTASRCSCKVAGLACTTLCHKGRGKNKFCTLFADLCCSEEEEEETAEVEEGKEESTPAATTPAATTPAATTP